MKALARAVSFDAGGSSLRRCVESPAFPRLNRPRGTAQIGSRPPGPREAAPDKNQPELIESYRSPLVGRQDSSPAEGGPRG
jgi:hypothetical protein